MRKAMIAGLVLVVLATAAFMVLKPSQKSETTVTTVSKPVTNSTQPITSTQEGRYLDYTPDIIASTSGTKVLFFHAPWCPQCRELDADIKSKGVPDGVNIIKIDYDSHQKERQKYGITIQTTLIKVDDQGNLLKKYVAYDEPNLEAVKRNLLD